MSRSPDYLIDRPSGRGGMDPLSEMLALLNVEAARFGTAFKRVTGTSPAHYRKLVH